MAGIALVRRALILAAASALVAIPSAQQAPTVRSSIDVVPLEVRVVDRRGRPITGLTATDFTVMQDGRPLTMNVFAEVRDGRLHSTTTRSTGSATAPTETPSTGGAAGARPRVFLIYFGRGRLQHPAMGVDAALSFVKNGLAPGDQVAVAAWNRATPFSTSPADILPVLERFRDRHAGIEQHLLSFHSGVRALLNATSGGAQSELPATLQAQIDDVFGPRLVPTEGTPDPALRDRNAAARRVMSALLSDGHMIGEVTEADGWAAATPDDFAEINTRGLQDVTGLYGAVAYLSLVEGEKHLLYVTEHGAYSPRSDDDRSLAARAAAARVTISVVHTGGTPQGPSPNTHIPTSPPIPKTREAAVGELQVSRAPEPWLTSSFMPPGGDWRINTSQALADQTGGYFTSTSAGSTFFDRVNTESNHYYQIGVVPPASSSRLGRLTVEVSRRNVDVRYRRTYADHGTPPPSRREAYAAMRLGAAAVHPNPPTDIQTSARLISGTATSLLVEVTAGPSGLTIRRLPDGTNRVSLNLALFFRSERGELLGQVVQAVDVTLSPGELAAVETHGLQVRVPATVRSGVRRIQAIVYDWQTDVIGSVTINR
jgi:VWFA-related protein